MAPSSHRKSTGGGGHYNNKNRKKVAYINYAIVLVSLIGVGLAIYLYTLHLHVERDSHYKGTCDFGPHLSCTKSAKTRYGKGFGVLAEDNIFNLPNSLYGIIYYSLNATLAFSNSAAITRVAYWLCLLVNLVSFYMAFILYFRVEVICVVCVATYICNIALINLTNFKLKMVTATSFNGGGKKGGASSGHSAQATNTNKKGGQQQQQQSSGGGKRKTE